MDTRQVVLVDAFATEPTGGVPVAVVPDGTDVPDDRLRAVARELDALATALPTDGPPADLRAIGPGGPADHHPQVAVGGAALAAERGWIGSGDVGLTVGGNAQEATVDDEGRAWIGIDDPDPGPADVGPGTIADALGVDAAAFRDVGADLPPFRVSVGIEALAAPVNFLEHLGSVATDRDALADLAETAGVEAVCVFTFDTLTAEASCHARTFVTDGARRGGRSPATASPWVRTVEGEVPVTPAVAGGVATHLSREAVIEDARSVVEQGHYRDRPGRVHVDPGGVRIGGRAVASFDGTMTLPPSDDEDILEA